VTDEAITYHRVSTQDQHPELAREELRRAALARGLTIIAPLEETGSGANNDRPELQRALKLARGRTLLVWKLDRFGRSALDVLTNIQRLTDAGGRFVAVTQGLDIRPDGDAMSKLILGVLAAVAEFERELIRERTRLGLARARARGVRLGAQCTTTPEQAASVRQAREAGRSWREAAQEAGVTMTTARRLATKGVGPAPSGGTPETGVCQ